MSIFGTMRTGVSGMNAQANKLGTVGDNIANASTTGYKRASTSFSSLVLPSSSGSYASGGVQSNVRYSISEQGNLSYTTSSTDLAIQGNGFFVVQDGSGTPYLTRAGSFVKNSEGYLENAAGFQLMGYPYGSNPPAAVVNGFTGLEAINVNNFGLTASPSTQGSFPANLNRDDKVATAPLPSGNLATAEFGNKTSLTAFDSGGAKVLYDFYYTKTGDNTWEVAVYRQDQSTNGGFPYTATPASDLVQESVTLTFDPATNKLTTTSDNSITINDQVSGVAQAIEIDLSQMTQFSSKFTPGTAVLNGNGPSQIKDVEIGKDGLVTAVYQDGGRRNIYQLALATVPSVDNLSPQNGNVYLPSNESGVVTIGFAQTGSFGYIQKGALEGSNVDIASELTDMIESQRIYTANSKVFQTGSDLMDVLINLKR
ncbi:Flagellar hook protein FlgE [Agrobacterium deltaense Zutra 3/1]|uniref:Flagellar hook protein FlgE n=1 Tax=Agrobacterium deltaense Zutra 3/1 TaxID=1183427 RepID=A0A1S7Q7E2_9HYPH|nr:flagellar hook protein FlgE [Agrobacterium deltaense]CUX32083.1 Flagellar hook protein FlgE [Agrobacterium deltaense Zutra 3/1]